MECLSSILNSLINWSQSPKCNHCLTENHDMSNTVIHLLILIFFSSEGGPLSSKEAHKRVINISTDHEKNVEIRLWEQDNRGSIVLQFWCDPLARITIRTQSYDIIITSGLQTQFCHGMIVVGTWRWRLESGTVDNSIIQRNNRKRLLCA